MHNCEEFRERMTEHIIDREELAANPEFHSELVLCSSCAEFYAQSSEMMEALNGVDLTIGEGQWTGIEQRLSASILNAAPKPVGAVYNRPEIVYRPKLAWATPVLLATAAAILLAVGVTRMRTPQPVAQTTAEPSNVVYVEHTVPLDPVTVDFLQESELLLRNVMKMAPTDAEDLADAKKVAREQLAELEQRKEAAASVQPVVDVMDVYETVLRDLRNVDDRSAEDITDLQKRIQKNGLIANMKAFQPRLTEVSFGSR
jgi:hypothetical protein